MVIIQNAHGASVGGTMDVLRAFIYPNGRPVIGIKFTEKSLNFSPAWR